MTSSTDDWIGPLAALDLEGSGAQNYGAEATLEIELRDLILKVAEQL